MRLTKANLLTMWRLVTAPAFLAVWFAVPGRAGLIVCLVLAVTSEISDGLDGYFARRDRTVSAFGKLMDPYADSIFRLAALLCFASPPHGPWYPLWMPILLVWRDIGTSIIRTFAMEQGVAVAARWSGKLKAVSQAVALIMTMSLAILYGEGLPAEVFGRAVAMPLTAIVVVAGRSVFVGEREGGGE